MEVTGYKMNKPTPISDCLISQPIYYPDEEIITWDGFAWSNSKGIILQSQNSSPAASFSDWLGNQQ
jgi:hypothetical protein